ncbi:uncharacterized protein V1510DRAFT_127165 [Dipodascopsis tothii]|uniref:uncharacterized protein n=1 Tax=Dipodascopsis tothii TaxID=44089 RepID=UPI0034CE6886
MASSLSYADVESWNQAVVLPPPARVHTHQRRSRPRPPSEHLVLAHTVTLPHYNHEKHESRGREPRSPAHAASFPASVIAAAAAVAVANASLGLPQRSRSGGSHADTPRQLPARGRLSLDSAAPVRARDSRDWADRDSVSAYTSMLSDGDTTRATSPTSTFMERSASDPAAVPPSPRSASSVYTATSAPSYPSAAPPTPHSPSAPRGAISGPDLAAYVDDDAASAVSVRHYPAAAPRAASAAQPYPDTVERSAFCCM